VNDEVRAWFESYENPHAELVRDVHEFLLSIDPKIEDCIKWKTPTVTYKGNIASFNPRSKKHVSLMFHTGAKIPGTFANLHVSGDTAAYMTFEDEKSFASQKGDLRKIVEAWIAWKDGR
jgi:uncharacterized protein YdhG (YjbR/CyaY superfamily)